MEPSGDMGVISVKSRSRRSPEVQSSQWWMSGLRDFCVMVDFMGADAWNAIQWLSERDEVLKPATQSSTDLATSLGSDLHLMKRL